MWHGGTQGFVSYGVGRLSARTITFLYVCSSNTTQWNTRIRQLWSWSRMSVCTFTCLYSHVGLSVQGTTEHKDS